MYPTHGQPTVRPWRLALICVLQFIEDLPDRQAAEAVRSRIDWKYVLGLELTDSGFDFSVLCEFRARLMAGGAEQQLLDTEVLIAEIQNLTQKNAALMERTAIAFSQVELELLRDRILSELKLGKQAPGYKAIQKALNHFITELTYPNKSIF